MSARLSVVCCLLSGALVCAQESHITLHDGWTFCQAGKEQWYSAEVPGVVQTDLLRHGLIPEFYKGSNIDSVQWIENEDWIYKRTIVANDSLLKHGHVDLVFKGLDTFAEVYLNDSMLGKADNMFRTWEWPIKEVLKTGANVLKVIFRSPIKEGAKLRDAYGIQLPHDNDPSGVSPYIRKAAYQFGWDFCPRLVTSGIWQGVELRCWNDVLIYQPFLTQKWHGDTVDLTVAAGLLPAVTLDGRYRASVYLDGTLEARMPAGPEKNEHGITTISIPHPERWWPANEGKQTMHEVRIDLFHDDGLIGSVTRMIGLRTMELDETGSDGTRSFTFKVNGRRIFMKGCNIVPPAMVPSGSDSAWVALVGHMKAGHMNMARIWAGGIYPPDAFFDACDKAGILVWQDLMFANMTPGNDAFLRQVETEAVHQVLRLMGHPSLALWCGNNELDVAWRNWGWQKTYQIHGVDSTRVIDAHRQLFWGPTLSMLAEHMSKVPYSPTSPLSNWGNAEGLKNGDLHYWGVWHGDSAVSSFKNNVGRFVSEYGFQSYADSALLSHYIDPNDLHLGSPAMKRMQRSYKTDKPIWDAIKRELGNEPKTLGEFIEDSQEVQAKAYRMAIEAHMAAQPHCMGTLFWQLNDCWPGPSWSLIDFEGNWKPGMYEVQRLYQTK